MIVGKAIIIIVCIAILACIGVYLFLLPVMRRRKLSSRNKEQARFEESFLKASKAKTHLDQGFPSPGPVSAVLTHALLSWCSPSNIADIRHQMQLPSEAVDFEVELFYLYYFLILAAIEASYHDNPEFGLQICKSFIDSIKDAIIAGNVLSFNVSTETMRERYTEYSELLKGGLENLVQLLPFSFLSIHVCQSSSPADVIWAKLYIERYVFHVFEQILSLQKEFRNHYRL
jgi:hypothetical protein